MNADERIGTARRRAAATGRPVARRSGERPAPVRGARLPRGPPGAAAPAGTPEPPRRAVPVPAAGADSAEHLAGRPIGVIADQIGWPVVTFPGGHTGYARHPVPFATLLARLDAALGDRCLDVTQKAG